MDPSSLKGRLPNEILESLQARGINRLTPPQEQAVAEGLLDGSNIVVSAPTASGKTLIAEMACVRAILGERRKAVYIAPMRDLVMEKFNEFKSAYPYLKAVASIGDLDSNDQFLQNYDILFVSTEKFDSLMRHGVEWLPSIGCVVFDEIHMLGDASRGPTLEILITKLASRYDAQIIALSATIGNSKEIAKWLDAKLVESDYRPVRLKKGIINNGTGYFLNSDLPLEISEEELGGGSKIPEIRLLEDTLARSKQMLSFYATKRNAEAGAVKLSATTETVLKEPEKKALEELSGKILNVLERPTEQCTKLSNLVKKGAAFHHAGLINQQRFLVEDAFRRGLIKAVCSTTTLGIGVNLPAHTVLVRDISRYDGSGSEMMGVNEVMQLFGRAGRPKYDSEGRALLIAASKERVSELYRSYILARPEEVDSNLGIVPVLRTHILAFIAENFLNDKKGMEEFLLKTFYGFQYRNKRHISELIEEITEELADYEFIAKERDGYIATKLGKRVSELYIDPLSAKWIINQLEREQDELGILFTITNTIEMRPYVRATEEAYAMYAARRAMYYDKKLTRDYENIEYGYYDPARAFSTALLLRDWVREKREQEIVKEYRTTPGELYVKVTNADWIIYSAIELAKILHRSQHDLINMRVRLKYGITDELLDLVRLQYIGRVRARTLFMNGIKKVSDIRENREKVIKLLGREISAKVFEQLGG